jgi:hypothetical protein
MGPQSSVENLKGKHDFIVNEYAGVQKKYRLDKSPAGSMSHFSLILL